MSITVQIRDLDDDIYAGLTQCAANGGVTVDELLRAAATRLVAESNGTVSTASIPQHGSSISRADILAAIAEGRRS